nr:MAG TPA: hypothetical protein [Caudoviricetes sp.]
MFNILSPINRTARLKILISSSIQVKLLLGRLCSMPQR